MKYIIDILQKVRSREYRIRNSHKKIAASKNTFDEAKPYLDSVHLAEQRISLIKKAVKILKSNAAP